MTERIDTILVVDDEPANLRMMERLLRSRYRVLTAPDGQEALNILRRENVSLLLTDQRMPGMTGIELMLASCDINSDIAKLMVTASTDNQTFMNAINEAGALRVIHKPWEPAMVLQFVEEALTQRGAFIESRQATAQLDETMEELLREAERLKIFITRD